MTCAFHSQRLFLFGFGKTGKKKKAAVTEMTSHLINLYWLGIAFC
jgi:hypothetical protein